MNIKQSIKDLSAKGCYKSTKKWWKSLTPTQKSVAIGILVAVICSPLIIAYAKKMMVTTFVPDANGGLWIIEQAAPLWHKILFSTFFIGIAGIASAGYAQVVYEEQ